MGGELDQRDVAALADAVHHTYRAERAEEFPALAMRLAAGLIPSDLTSFNDVDPSRCSIVAEYAPHDWPMFPDAFETFGRLQHDHPIIRYIADSGDGSAKKITDFVPLDVFMRSRIYVEFYARVGTTFQMSIALPAVSPRIVGLALNRAAPGCDFDERDRTLLNLLRPHLAQAYEHVRTRDRLTRQVSALTGLASARGEHVIALDPHPVEITPGAMSLVARYFGALRSSTGLPEDFARWVEEQRRILRTVRRDEPPPAFQALTTTGSHGRLVARFVPGHRTCDVIVVVERPSDERVHLQRLGLSRRESEIIHLLATGASNSELAARLFISPGTVKKHLDNIYRKLGVTNRLQAVSVAFELLAVDRAGDDAGA